VRLNILSGNISVARDEFESLENRDKLITDLMRNFFRGNRSNLDDELKFTYELRRYFSLVVKAARTLFDAMENYGQVMEMKKQLIYLYCLVLKIKDDSNFDSVQLELKKQYFYLKKDMDLHAKKLRKGFESDIYSESWDKLKEMHVYLGNDLTNVFAAELGKEYYQNHRQFGEETAVQSLLMYMEFLPNLENWCYLLESTYQAMKVNGEENSRAAFHLWLWSRYLLYQARGEKSTDSWNQKCKIVYDQGSGLKQKYVEEYANLLFKDKNFITLQNRHKSFISTKCILPDVILSLNSNSFNFNKEEFQNLVKLINDLPWIPDVCLVLGAAHDLLKNLQKLNESENLQILKIAHLMMTHENYKNVVGYFKGECERVKSAAAEVFVQLLWNKTSDCKLVNRFYGEPLYVTGDSLKTSDGNRFIYTWTPKSDDISQSWEVYFLFPEGKVWFRNINARFLYTKKGWTAPFGGFIKGDPQEGLFWRVSAVDEKYLMIRSVYG